ncbi:MAG: DUF4190 domain-containing protein [Methylacidiphilales bacterium]|nr:DUF4190 domain-containing protein [Candidatus Methylacidiphilales bacterium]
MQIFIHHDNQQQGPFTEDEIKAKLASGAISLQDHVWWQGQADWIPLGQSSLVASGAPAAAPPVPGMPAVPLAVAPASTTSQLAIWSLVCGCLSLLCSIFTAIPAIILGHMGRSEIKKNPALQGGGMALAGLILGYVFTAFSILYLSIVGISVLIALGNQVKGVSQTIQAQLNSAEATNSADQSANAPDQTAPAPATTNSPDQSTNSAPASTNAPDSSTNSPTPSTNAPDSSTNAAPVNQ